MACCGTDRPDGDMVDDAGSAAYRNRFIALSGFAGHGRDGRAGDRQPILFADIIPDPWRCVSRAGD